MDSGSCDPPSPNLPQGAGEAMIVLVGTWDPSIYPGEQEEQGQMWVGSWDPLNLSRGAAEAGGARIGVGG